VIIKKEFVVALLLISYAPFLLPTGGCLSSGNPPNTEQQTKQGRDNMLLVERVIDGDTFMITGDEPVRLIGVDAPEARKGASAEPYGKEASAFTSVMLEGMQVKLLFDVKQRDQYGRLLAYVYLEDGKFFNELLVREGYALVYTVPPNVAKVETLLEAQQHAMKHKLGLWGLTDVLDVK